MITARKALRVLHLAGFYVHHQAGSHVRLIHPKKTYTVTVPIHSGDLGPFLVASIIRQSGLTRDRFLALLDE